MNKELIKDNRVKSYDGEGKDRFSWTEVTQLWKCSNENESVYVEVFYKLKEDSNLIDGKVVVKFDKRGNRLFDKEKKEWFIFDKDVDFFDTENDKIYLGSTEFEKEVCNYWNTIANTLKYDIE